MFRTIRQLLAAVACLALVAIPATGLTSASDVPCGSCGAWVSVGGANIAVGSYSTQAEADAAAADDDLISAAVDSYVELQASSVTCGTCQFPTLLCFPYTQTRDFSWEVIVSQSGSGFLVTVVLGADPAYRVCCRSCY
jgi:hypothetical protein